MADLISNSSYDYDERFLELAKDFFDLEQVSTAKAGMFGYHTAIHSNIAKDAVFHRNMLFREFFLNTSSMNDSVYNWARILDHNIDLARPSYMPVALQIDVAQAMTLAERDSYGTVEGGFRVFRFARDQVFTIGPNFYAVPHEIFVYCRMDGTVPSVSARYDFSDAASNYKDPLVTTEHLKVLVEGSKATIFFNLYQLSVKSTYVDVLSNDDFDNSIFDVTFGKNLVSFTVKYQSPGTSSWVDVPVSFGEDWEGSNGQQNGYYTMVDDRTLRIFFSSKPGSFRPKFGSRLQVTTVTTDGSAGNFQYSGRVSMQNSFFENVGYTMINLADPTGGRDQIDFVETKKALIAKLRTRSSYITESDLGSFFDVVRQTRIKKNLKVDVIRTRDDVFRRIFSAYVLMRLKTGEVVPTTTTDLTVDVHQLVDSGFSIKPGTMVIYDRQTSSYRLLAKDEVPDPYFYNADAISFCVPYLMHLDFSEFPKTNVFRTSYKKTVTLGYRPRRPLSGNLMLNFVTISRNPLVDVDGFRVTADVVGDASALIGKEVVLVLKDPDTGLVAGLLPLANLPDTMTYHAVVKTSDSFSQNGRYLVEDTFYSPTDRTVVVPSLPVKGSYDVSIRIYDEGFRTEGDNYYVEYYSTSKVAIADDVSKFVHCPVVVDNETGRIVIKKVPLVGANFYFNETYVNDINDTVATIFGSVEEIDTAMENGTAIDVKFFNSRGPSYEFKSDTVDLRVRLQVKLKVPFSESLDYLIRKDIVAFVEGSNETMERRFSISNLITALERKFTEISYIQVFSINSANVQSIEVRPDHDRRDPDSVPEYLTVRKKFGSSPDGVQSFEYDVVIDYL